jgi:hypothetical protein
MLIKYQMEHLNDIWDLGVMCVPLWFGTLAIALFGGIGVVIGILGLIFL